MKIFRLLTNKQKFYCFTIIVVSLIGAGAGSVWPVLLSNIYDRISNSNVISVENLAKLIVSFGAVFFVSEVLAIVRRVSVDKTTASFEKHLRNISIAKLLRLPTVFYNSTDSGEYTAKINQSVAGSGQFIKVVCNNVVPSVFIGAFTIYQVLRKAPYTVALIMLSYIVFELVISICQIVSQNGIREGLIKKKAKLDGNICQAIRNIEVIRVMNAENYETARIEPKTETIRKTESKHHSYMGAFDSLKQIFKVLYTILLLVYSVYLVSQGDLSRGMVITIILLFQQLVVPIDAIHVFIDEIASSKVKAKELLTLLSMDYDKIFSEDLKDEAFSDDDIVINNVSVFSPDMNNVITNDVSMKLEKGKIIGLTGPTGCGKSSMLKGIMRFFPSVGDISIGDKLWSQTSQKSISNSILYMTQDSLFFEGTLKDNIVYGLTYQPTDEQLIFALKSAGIYEELLKKDSDIFNITVAENGYNFSGGQRQRIALARAFLCQPKWFFMDESTANLDSATTARVLSNLENYASSIGAGIVYISHQSEVTKRCDYLIDVVNKTKNAA